MCEFRWEEIEGNRELTPTGVEMLVEDDNGFIRSKTSCDLTGDAAPETQVSVWWVWVGIKGLRLRDQGSSQGFMGSGFRVY